MPQYGGELGLSGETTRNGRFERLCWEQLEAMSIGPEGPGARQDRPSHRGRDESAGERAKQKELCGKGCSGQHTPMECPLGQEGEDEGGRRDDDGGRKGTGCVLTDHCPNPCDLYLWDDEGENVVGYVRCQCDCCSGRCECRQWRTSGGEKDEHVCQYGEDGRGGEGGHDR